MSISVVTGGAGFIGSHLAARLAEGGQQVRVLDSLVSAASERRAAALAEMPGVEMVRGDIRDPETCRSALADAEYVFHHAAEVSVPQSVADPAACVAVNLGGLVNLLEAARTARAVKRLCWRRRARCMATRRARPSRKGRRPTRFRRMPCPSSLGKGLCCNYLALHGVQTISLRYFNVYGPDQDPNGAYACGHSKVYRGHFARRKANCLRRRRAVPRLCVCGRHCGRQPPRRLRRTGRARQSVQYRQRAERHPEPYFSAACGSVRPRHCAGASPGAGRGHPRFPRRHCHPPRICWVFPPNRVKRRVGTNFALVSVKSITSHENSVTRTSNAQTIRIRSKGYI